MNTLEAVTTIDPSTGAQFERIERTAPAEVDAALRAARERFARWRQTPLASRAALLRATAARLRARSEELAKIAVREMGKPIAQARSEIEKSAWCCEHFAEHGAAMLADETIATKAAASYAAFRPLGTILAIMPWNFPYWQVFRAAVPALMAGNTMLLKHAENTTRCGLEIERVFREAGAPEGLFRTLVIDHERADALMNDERIVAATLTGSDRAGVAIASAAGSHVKKVVLELGGSDAFVVLADADLDAAAELAVKGRFQNNGQSCIAAKRFIAVDAVHDAFLERFIEKARAQRIGDPLEEATAIGPMARADLRETMHAQVRDTVAAGARLCLGGKPLERAGYYYEPTIVASVEPGMRMFDEEVFGPAAAVVRARDERDAVELANRSSFGLGCSIHTRDTERAQSMARDIEAGSVFVNAIVASDPRLPFGGVKRSGHGRELSHFGIHEFTNIQTVCVGSST